MYVEHYGFKAKPFQLTPDPRFFFESSGHRRALAYLRYGVREGQGFIVITGGVGTGKTTLAESLFRELDPSLVTAAQVVSTQLEADDLLRSAMSAFGLDIGNKNKAILLKDVEDFLREHDRAGKRALLLVDEAQNLSMRALEELRMLSNFEARGQPLLQSFVLGQDEFRAMLWSPEMEQLRQRVIASCHLNPLSEIETRDYVEHRLRVVGWKDNPSITADAYTALHGYSQGIPRRVNLMCDRLLLYGCLEDLSELDRETVDVVVAEMDAGAPVNEGRSDPQTSTTPEQTATRPAPPLVQTATVGRLSGVPLPGAIAPSLPSSPHEASQGQPDAAMASRMFELERLVAGLTLDRQMLENRTEVDKLAREIAELKPAVESLQRGIWELTKLIGSRLSKKDAGT